MPVRRCLALLLAPLALVAGVACQHDFAVEGREVPVHVWLTVPDMPAQGGTVDALVYVGAQKVVEGPVRFPAGAKTINMPIVHVRGGDTLVSAVTRRGASSARDTFEIARECWIQVVLRGTDLELRHEERQPDPYGG